MYISYSLNLKKVFSYYEAYNKFIGFVQQKLVDMKNV